MDKQDKKQEKGQRNRTDNVEDLKAFIQKKKIQNEALKKILDKLNPSQENKK